MKTIVSQDLNDSLAHFVNATELIAKPIAIRAYNALWHTAACNYRYSTGVGF
jgi:hypothetical protein